MKMEREFKYIYKRFNKVAYAEMLFWISKDNKHVLALFTGINTESPRVTIVAISKGAKWLRRSLKPVIHKALVSFLKAGPYMPEHWSDNIDGYQVDFVHMQGEFEIAMRFESPQGRGYVFGLNTVFHMFPVDLNRELLVEYFNAVLKELKFKKRKRIRKSRDSESSYFEEPVGFKKKTISATVDTRSFFENRIIDIKVESTSAYIFNMMGNLYIFLFDEEGGRAYKVEAKDAVRFSEKLRESQKAHIVIDEENSLIKVNNQEFHMTFKLAKKDKNIEL